jgi:hypothetical protein
MDTCGTVTALSSVMLSEAVETLLDIWREILAQALGVVASRYVILQSGLICKLRRKSVYGQEENTHGTQGSAQRWKMGDPR